MAGCRAQRAARRTAARAATHLHSVQAVKAQVVGEVRLRVHLGRVHLAKGLDDLHDALGDGLLVQVRALVGGLERRAVGARALRGGGGTRLRDARGGSKE